MIGIHHEIYARHERAADKLTMTRLLHLAELLDFSPVEAICAVKSQFFGSDRKKADIKVRARHEGIGPVGSSSRGPVEGR
jgi:hypothetical protein